MTWTNNTFYSLDIETTNADPMLAQALTISIVKFQNGAPVDKRSWILDCEGEVTPEAVEVHGMTTEWIRANGMDPRVGLDEAISMVHLILKGKFPLVVYNAAYDLTVIENQSRRLGISSLTDRIPEAEMKTVVDPFILVRGYETYLTPEGAWGNKFTLPAVCERYGVKFNETHDAYADAVGAGELTIALIPLHSKFRTAGPNVLTEIQKTWRVRLQDGLREYFDRKKIEHDGVDAGWPLHSSFQS